jgi:hypothetical protein
LNSEIARSVKVMKVINEHLQEKECNHNIKTIMKEALEENKRAVLITAPTQAQAINPRSNRNDYRD